MPSPPAHDIVVMMTSGLTCGNSVTQCWASTSRRESRPASFSTASGLRTALCTRRRLISSMVGLSLLERKFERRFVVETRFGGDAAERMGSLRSLVPLRRFISGSPIGHLWRHRHLQRYHTGDTEDRRRRTQSGQECCRIGFNTHG